MRGIEPEHHRAVEQHKRLDAHILAHVERIQRQHGIERDKQRQPDHRAARQPRLPQRDQRIRPAGGQRGHAQQAVEKLTDVCVAQQQPQLHKSAIDEGQKHGMVVAERAAVADIAGEDEKLQNLVVRVVDIQPGRVEQQIGDGAGEDQPRAEPEEPALLFLRRGRAGLRVRAERVEQAEEQNDRAERRREQRRHRRRAAEHRLGVFEQQIGGIRRIIRIADGSEKSEQRGGNRTRAPFAARRADSGRQQEQQEAGGQNARAAGGKITAQRRRAEDGGGEERREEAEARQRDGHGSLLTAPARRAPRASHRFRRCSGRCGAPAP